VIISKKLFKAITGKDVQNIYELGSNPNLSYSELPYGVHGNGDLLFINIYELAHMCEAWAFNLGYDIPYILFKSDEDNTILFDMRVEGVENGINCCMYEFNHKSEIKFYCEAVFQACEWILNQKDIK